MRLRDFCVELIDLYTYCVTPKIQEYVLRDDLHFFNNVHVNTDWLLSKKTLLMFVLGRTGRFYILRPLQDGGYFRDGLESTNMSSSTSGESYYLHIEFSILVIFFVFFDKC